MTNESKCGLAPFCKHAGKPSICTDVCGAFIGISSRLERADIPKDYEGIYLDNSPAKDEQDAIYTPLSEYVKTFAKEGVRIKNLYLYSKATGTGKTTTAIALLNEYIRRRFLYYVRKKEQIPETLGLFLDLNEYQTKYNLATMSRDEDDMEAIKDAIIRYSNVEFLVVDDVGVRSATEAFRALIHSIINARVTNGLPTVFTSNIRLSELTTVFDDRLQDRIQDQCLSLTFKGESKRGRR